MKLIVGFLFLVSFFLAAGRNTRKAVLNFVPRKHRGGWGDRSKRTTLHSSAWRAGPAMVGDFVTNGEEHVCN